MSLIVILICLSIQRFLKFNSYSYQLHWVDPYYKWMTGKFAQITKGHGFVGAAILVLPILVLVAIVFALVFSWLGLIGYAVLSIAIVWYCMDGRDRQKDPCENRSAQDLFITSYRNLFGVIFWYALFGPVGLALYFVVGKLQNLITDQQTSSPEEETQSSLSLCMDKIMGVLDWVPVRLVGLSYALVGHFGSVFKSWLKKLSDGISNTHKLVSEWGMIALKDVAEDTQTAEAITLIDRALLVWLVVVFLVTVGAWLS